MGALLSQLIVQVLDQSPPQLIVVANPYDAAPISFERSDECKFIPRLGTQDLLALAHYAVHHGWEVDRLELQNVVTTEVVGTDDEMSASEEILSDLAGSDLADVMAKFIRNFPALSVVGVEFVRAEDDRAVILRRNGVVDAEDGVSPLDVLEPAWRDLEIA